MKKSALCMTLVLLMIMSLVCPASAATFDNDTIPIPTATGRITYEDGTYCNIIGTLVAISTPSRLINSDTEATYRFDLYDYNVQNNSLEVSQGDGALCSTVYLTIHYSAKNEPTEYRLNRVSGYWEIRDSRVSIESAYLSYGCSGFFPQPIVQNALDVPVTNNFNISTGFTNYVTSDGGVMGANLTLNYLMGTTRRWSFTLQNLLFNNPTIA